jgi:hypothetical protein
MKINLMMIYAGYVAHMMDQKLMQPTFSSYFPKQAKWAIEVYMTT